MHVGSPEKGRKTALIEGASAGTLFGTAAVLIRFLTGLSAFSIAFWRLVVASFVLIIAVLFFSRKSFNVALFRRDSWRILILGGLLGLHFILFASAVLDTTIINATVLVNTTPIWSMFISSIIFKLRPSKSAALGITLSIVGVLMIGYADASSRIWTVQLKGDSEAILAAIVEAIYLNYGRETRRRMPLIPLMLVIYAVSAVTVLTISAVAGIGFTFALEPSLVLTLIGLGILPTALAHSLYFSSLSNLKSFETATMALLEPIGATLLGWIVLSQIPDAFFVMGAGLVLTGVVFVAARK